MKESLRLALESSIVKRALKYTANPVSAAPDSPLFPEAARRPTIDAAVTPHDTTEKFAASIAALLSGGSV